MKALLVTSRIQFVPNNYDTLINDLAQSEHVGGLLVIDNLNPSLIKMACGISIMGAWRLGIQILKNILSFSHARRKRAYARQNKPIWMVKSINSSQSKAIISQEKFELIINARTRAIFRPEVLRMPLHGCINIHHGLLPEQRGVLCDLWALSENRPAGFSIHYMTEEIDAGPIISRIQVSEGRDQDFLAYLRKSVELERHELEKVLSKLASNGAIELVPNKSSPETAHRKNPSSKEIRHMKKNGMKI